MQPNEKGRHPVAGRYVPREVLADPVKGSPPPVAPEIAAERAANRIIQALREAENRNLEKTENA